MQMIELREATPEDLDLAYAVTEEAMRGYVEATWGAWDPALQAVLHAKSFDPSTHWIVLEGGKPIGVVAARVERRCIRLIKLYLRDGARGRGIGATLLLSLLRAAEIRHLPVRLRVLAVNERALSFYARHGFQVTRRVRIGVHMEARATPRDVVALAREVFGGVKRAQAWLSKPHPALDGEPPGQRAQARGGVQSVRDLLGAIRHGGAA
jgi:GNAT superfamily N-acetyltransferase